VAAIDDVVAGRALPAAPATVVPPAGAVPPPRSVSAPIGATRSVARATAPGRRGRVATVLLPLLALLAGAGIAAAVLQVATDGGSPAATAAAAEQHQNGSIVLDAANYIGRPSGQVAEKLTALGLTVQLREQVTADTLPDRVTGIDPAGTPLSAGDTVVVSYAVAPPDSGRRTGGAAAVTGAAVRRPTAADTDASSAATSTPAPSADGATVTTLDGSPTSSPETGTSSSASSSESSTSSSESSTSTSEPSTSSSEPSTSSSSSADGDGADDW
jgi:serine/threonine-protein kinase